MGECVVRPQPDRLLQFGDMLLQLSLLAEHRDELDLTGKEGGESVGFAVLGDGLVQFALSLKDIAKVVVYESHLRHIGAAPDRLAEFGDGLLRLPLFLQSEARLERSLN